MQRRLFGLLLCGTAMAAGAFLPASPKGSASDGAQAKLAAGLSAERA